MRRRTVQPKIRSLVSPISAFWQGKVQTSSPISALLRWRHFRLTLSVSLSHRAHLTHNIGSASALPIIHVMDANPNANAMNKPCGCKCDAFSKSRFSSESKEGPMCCMSKFKVSQALCIYVSSLLLFHWGNPTRKEKAGVQIWAENSIKLSKKLFLKVFLWENLHHLQRLRLQTAPKSAWLRPGPEINTRSTCIGFWRKRIITVKTHRTECKLIKNCC